MNKNLPSVTILFPNFNGNSRPLECLASIFDLNYPKKSLQVIVIDNASTDGSNLKIRKSFYRVKLLQLKKNVGFAKAINLAIKHVRSKYIFVTNDDVIFSKNSLRELVEYMNPLPDIGVASGAIESYGTSTPRFSTGHTMNSWTGSLHPVYVPKKVDCPEWVQGCALLTPTSLFRNLGGFDEQFEHFFEDFDYCIRVRKDGKKIVSVPTAKFRHAESTTANRNLPQKHYNWYKSKIRFVIKNLPLQKILSILLIQTFLVMPYRTVFLRDKRLSAFAKGFAWNLKNISNTWSVR